MRPPRAFLALTFMACGIAALVGVLFALGQTRYFDERRMCRDKGVRLGAPAHYTPITGCRLQLPSGRWVAEQ